MILWCIEDSKFIISRDVTFDENSMVASLKAMVPSGDDVGTSKSQVVEIEPKDQPGSSRVQEEYHADTQEESETVQQENVQASQQQ